MAKWNDTASRILSESRVIYAYMSWFPAPSKGALCTSLKNVPSGMAFRCCDEILDNKLGDPHWKRHRNCTDYTNARGWYERNIYGRDRYGLLYKTYGALDERDEFVCCFALGKIKLRSDCKDMGEVTIHYPSGCESGQV